MTTALDGMRLQALEGLSQAVVIVRADASEDNFTTAYANRAAAALLGEDAVRRGIAARIFPDGGARRLLQDAVRDRRAATVYGASRNAEGSALRLHVETLPLQDEDSGSLMTALYLRAAAPADNATRNEALAYAALDAAADELALTGARLRTATDAFPGLVLFVDADGEVCFAAGESLFDLGLSSERLENASIQDVAPEVGDELSAIAEAALAGARLRFDFRLLDRVYEALAVPVRMDTGRPCGAMVALRDVSDAREAFELLAPQTRWTPASED